MFFAFSLFCFSVSIYISLEVTADLSNSGVKSSHSQDEIFRELSLFEFVTPAILTQGRWRRDASTRTTVGHRDKFVLKVPSRSKSFVLDLTLNRDLLPADFVAKHYDEKGKLVTTRPQPHENCFYQGSLRGVANSVVSISTCKGIEGLIHDGNESYYVQPVNQEDVKQHILYNMRDLIQKETKCGTHGPGQHSADSWDLLSLTHESPFIKHRVRRNIDTEVKYVELVLVNDFKQFQYYKRNVKDTEYRGKHIINLVDSLYRPLNVRVALLMMITWSNGDKIKVEVDSDKTLSNFLDYRNKDIVNLLKSENIKSHDNAQLLSRSNFAGSTVGKAQVMAMCSRLSGAVVKDHSGTAARTAATSAHEMGHNFGLNHDNDYKRDECLCDKETGCIMSSVAKHKAATKWSECSREEFEKSLKRGLDSCLFNQPRRLYGDAVCGNGFKEEGEECDCGTLEECKRYSDNCCNTTTCKLHPHAECSEGACCSKCKFRSAGSECRERINYCDVPEQCNGKSELCPENVYVQNGWPCEGGYCFNGRCPTHDQQCADLWGKEAKNAPKVCYTTNVRGRNYANCGVNSTTKTFIKCQAADMRCGKVWCKQESKHNLPIIGVDRAGFSQEFRSLGIKCWSAEVDLGDDVPDPTLTMDGVKCGDDKVCHENKCIHIHAFSWKLSLCPKNCSGNGVCTTKDECFCDPCWGGSDCATSVRCPWESEARTPIAGIVIAVFIIALLIVGLVLAFLKRQLLYQKWQNYNKKRTSSTRYNHVSADTPKTGRSAAVNKGRSKPQDDSHAMQPSRARLEISGPLSVDSSTPATVVTPSVTTTPKPTAVSKPTVNGPSSLPGWPSVKPQQKPVFTATSWQSKEEEPAKKPMWKPPVQKSDSFSNRSSSGDALPPKRPEWPPRPKEGEHLPPKKPIWPPQPNRASSPPGALDTNPAFRPPPKPRPGSHAGILNQEKPGFPGKPGSDPQLSKKPSFGRPKPSPLARAPSGAQEIGGAGQVKARPPGLPVARKPSGAKNLEGTRRPGTAPPKPPVPLGRKPSGSQDLDGTKKPSIKPLRTSGVPPGRPTSTPIVPAGAKKPPPVGKVPLLPPGKGASSRQ